MSQGICYIAFGQEYDRLAAHTIAYSRKFIKCGITVLTNLKERDAKWLSVPDVNFVYLDIPTNENRRVKIELHKYSPYNETLYMDVDAIVIKHGIEKIFDFLKGKDIVFQHHALWENGKRYARIYRDTAIKLGIVLPLRIVLGGFLAFRKTPQTVALFEQWKRNWTTMGCGRDMPSLACAIKQTGIDYNCVLRDNEKLFSFGVKYDCIAIHRVKSDDLKKHGIPIHKQNKPFDINRHDWDRVYFDEKEILNNKWILSKFNEKERTERQEQYIKKYLPEINRGGKYILDVAAGPGEFMDIAKKRGCKTIGVEMIEPIENIENEELRIKYITTKHVEKGLDIIYSDFNRILSDGHKAVNNMLFDIINCQSAINKINCASFDYKRGAKGVYDNNGEWIVNERFDAFFNVFFQWCKKHLVPGGVLMLAALNATNKKQYSERIQKIAIDNKFKVEINDRDLEHRFRKAA